MATDMATDGLDVKNVVQWDGRPKRERKQKPMTYWEEFVETDVWYQHELVRDVPADEMYAACEDSDIASDEGEDSESVDTSEHDDEFLDDVTEEDEEDSTADDESDDAE